MTEEEFENRLLHKWCRKVVNRNDLRDGRESIAEAFGSLPPPWEWRDLREEIGLTIPEMSVLSGLSYNRIRLWENGMGTSDASVWLRYATALAAAVRSVRETGRPPAEVEESYGRRNEFASQGEVITDDDAAGQVAVIRGLVLNLEEWTARSGPAKCSPEDLAAMIVHLRSARRAATRAYNQVKKEQERNRNDGR